ncbi:hypothetical protein KFL_000130070 [Klebsormidium nitens]|uniref:Uncharacterized protein n=1 Tax=Klebsormidium nitens TaxID=105231 RepID=A0A1Y1HIU1_KLENI|nr:hypothetical protein KFL_000130070 [Klebsormidium nitens]|eukprot:GAQ78425.1 hypothetical protein KFL_000130070 [Klebsormidium nitens]
MAAPRGTSFSLAPMDEQRSARAESEGKATIRLKQRLLRAEMLIRMITRLRLANGQLQGTGREEVLVVGFEQKGDVAIVILGETTGYTRKCDEDLSCKLMPALMDCLPKVFHRFHSSLSPSEEISMTESFNRLIRLGRVGYSVLGITDALRQVLLAGKKPGPPGSLLEAVAHEIAPLLAAATGIPSRAHEWEAVEEGCEEPVTFPRATRRCSSLRIARLEKLSVGVGVQVEEKTGVRVTPATVSIFRKQMWMVGLANPNLELAASTMVDE